MIHYIGCTMTIGIIKFLIKHDLKIMDSCEKTLDLSDVEDMEHAEFHAERRRELGAVLAAWQDRRDRRASRPAA